MPTDQYNPYTYINEQNKQNGKDEQNKQNKHNEYNEQNENEWKPALDFIKDMQAAFVLYAVVYDENQAAIDLRVIFANDFYYNTLGLKPAAVIGQLYSKLLPQDMSWLPLYANVALEEKRVHVFEAYSEEKQMHLHTQVYAPKRGQVACMHFVRSDFASNELKARKLAAIIAIADAGIIIKDKDARVVDWNSGAKNILGYTAEEMIGKTTRNYTPEENRAVTDAVDERLKQGEHIANVEVVKRHKDGHLVYCEASYTPMFDVNGRFDGYVAIFHDITEKKEMEWIFHKAVKEMAEQTNLMQVLIDTIPHPVFYKDAETRFLGCNVAYCEAMGVNSDDLIGRTVLDLDYLPQSDRAAYQAEDQRIIRENGRISYETPIPFADGKVHETLYSVTGFKKEDGHPGGLIGIFIDIAEMRAAERALAAAKKEVEEHHRTIMQSMDYASKIQKNLLPPERAFQNAFKDYAVIWAPRDTVGGDMYWVKNFDEGTVLCVCDCTGHGIPGALLTMVVVSTLDMAVDEQQCNDTAQIIWEIEKRLVSIFNVKSPNTEAINTEALDAEVTNRVSINTQSSGDECDWNMVDIHDGCELAVLFIAKDGTVTISSSRMHVFICDGQSVTQIKGQKIRIGDGAIKQCTEIHTTTIPAKSSDNKNSFYIASDGLYEQPGGSNRRPFGYEAFKQLILAKHNDSQRDIADCIWHAFENHRGTHPRVDDFVLVSFTL